VLKDDSRRRVQRVKGSSHFILELGTRLLVAMADQVIESGERQGELERKLTLFHPIEFGLGYRGRFESWGLEITNHAAIGLNQTSSSRNPGGGHIDYGGNAGLAIHFLRYHNPRGLTSFYGGAGASFDLLWFRVINPATSADRHSTLFSGGLSGQGVIGWEFMRAAAVQFFLQGELNIPAYLVRTENSVGRMKSWAPGVTLRIGMVF